MKTAVDFMAAGIVFESSGGHRTARGPAGRPDLVEALRAEIERRVPRFYGDIQLVRDQISRLLGAPPRCDFCELCADRMENGRGGVCSLCGIACQKARGAPGMYTSPPPRPEEPTAVPAPAPRPRMRIPRLPMAA